MTPTSRSARHGDRLLRALLATASFTALLGGGLAQAGADDPATDKSEYQRKLVECKSQMVAQHPEMDSKAQRKACKAQLGPMPQGVVPAKAAAPVR